MRRKGRLSLEEIARMAEPRGIPVLVDAASEHLKRPNPYLEAGATMVAYSGGKYLRGPQPTGLLLGSGAWLRAAWTNAAPHHTFGRMMKVGKEEIMGLLAAVEHLVEGRDGQSEAARWVTDLETIATTRDGVGRRDGGGACGSIRKVSDASTGDPMGCGIDACSRPGTASDFVGHGTSNHAG